MFLKIAAQGFDVGNFLNIFLSFWGLFKAYFHIKTLFIKKGVMELKLHSEIADDSLTLSQKWMKQK